MIIHFPLRGERQEYTMVRSPVHHKPHTHTHTIVTHSYPGRRFESPVYLRFTGETRVAGLSRVKSSLLALTK